MATVPEIGKFDRPVTFRIKTTAKDSYGKPLNTYSNFRNALVSMEVMKSDEGVASDKKTSFTTYRVQMHYINGIVNKMVLYTRDTEETFEIISVIPSERKMFIELIVQKAIA